MRCVRSEWYNRRTGTSGGMPPLVLAGGSILGAVLPEDARQQPFLGMKHANPRGWEPSNVAATVVYLSPADKYHRLTHRPSQGQKGLDERAIMTSPWSSHPW